MIALGVMPVLFLPLLPLAVPFVPLLLLGVQ